MMHWTLLNLNATQLINNHTEMSHGLLQFNAPCDHYVI